MIKLNEMFGETAYIDYKQLSDAFPLLGDAYKKSLGAKHPKISVTPQDKYIFNPDFSDSMTDYFTSPTEWYILYKGQVKYFSNDSSKRADIRTSFELDINDAVLEIVKYYSGGSHYSVQLTVNPKALNPLMLDSDKKDLTMAEQFVLANSVYLKSSYRFDGFRRPHEFHGYINAGNKLRFPEADFLDSVKTFGKTYGDAYEAIIFSLQTKGFLTGAKAVTLNGKNEVLRLERIHTEERYGKE